MMKSRRFGSVLAFYSYGLSALIAIALMWFGVSPATAQQQPQQTNGTLQPPPPRNPPVLPRDSQHASPGALTSTSPLVFPALSQSSWTAIGPASLSGGGGNYSGRIAGVAVDPTNASNIYIAAAGGGVWNTTTGGTSWNPLTDSQVTLAMGAIAIAPSNQLKIYAGTGEANNSLDSNFGQGILISNDGGMTWSLSEGPGNVFSSNRLVIAQISVHPTNPNTAYAAVGLAGENGTFFAEGGTGIYMTTDGGTTWTNTTTGINEVTLDGTFNSTFPWSAVVIDPNTPTTVYAAHGYISNFHNYNSANGVYRSLDGGSTWALLSGAINAGSNSNTGRIAIAVAPSANVASHHVLYVAAESVATSGLLYFERSDNADAATPTFTTTLTAGTPDFGGGENSIGGQGWYDWVIAVDPANSANVYAAGVECYACGGTQAVILSTTSGASWTDISIVGGVEPHTDSHGIAFDSSSNMYLGNDGGIWKYNPNGPSWTNLNGNLNTIQFTGIGLHPSSSTSVLGGSQDNGTELYTGSTVWSQVDGGDGGFAQISPTLGTRCYHTFTRASFERSDSSCAAGTWMSETSGFLNGNGNFYAPYTLDPVNGDDLLFGGDRVYETTNAAGTWTPISTPGSNGFNSGGSNVNSVAIVPDTPVRYATTCCTATGSSQIFITINDGTSWTERDLPVGGNVNELDVDPNDNTGNTVIAVINRFNGSNGQVYRTTSGGTSWSNITANLPAIPTWSAKIDTDTNHTIYVSNETAVYSSPSPYTTWTAYGTGLPNVQGVHLELNSSLHILALATHGRGAWEVLTVYAPNAVVSPSSLTFSSQNVGTTSASQPVTLTNNGTSALTIASIAIGGTNPTDFGQTNNCPISPASLAAAANCTISVTFKPTATGSRSGTLIVTDNSGNVAGTQQTVGLTGTGAGAVPPAPVSVSPINGSGSPQTFTMTYSDANGTSDITYAYVMFNSTTYEDFGCWVEYRANKIYLRNDAGTAFGTGVTVGSTTPLSNSQCTVTGSSVSTSGDNLMLTLTATFASGFSGQKNVYALADGSGGSSGWKLMGTWTPAARQALTVGPISPINGSGATQTFSLSYPDPNGASDMAANYVLFSSSPSTFTNACWIYYNPLSNLLYLRNDGSTAWGTGIAPGSATQLNNSQCTVTGSSVAFTPGGVTLGLSLTFSGTFTAKQNVYMDTLPNAPGTATGYKLQGTWTGVAEPNAVVSPSTLTFSSQNVGTTSASQPVTLTNTGSSALIITSIAIGGTNPADFGQTNNCPVSPASLAFNANCTISVTFTPAVTGSLSGTLIVTDNSGNVSGAQQSVGLTGTGAGTVLPAPFSVSPINGSGSPQKFTMTYSDANGTSDITYAYVMFNPTTYEDYGCWVEYRANNIYLRNDGNTAWSTGVPVGSTTPLSNSQCTVTGSSVSTSGDNLMLTLTATFASGFSGQKNVYMLADGSGGSSGWKLMGTWTPAARQALTVGPISPINGSGATQTFSLSYPDPNGTSDMAANYALFSSSASTFTNACWVYYNPLSNLLYLRNDGSTAWGTGIAPGSATQLNNSQCTVTGSSVAFTPGGVTLGLSLTFSGTFTAMQNVYMDTLPNAPGTATGYKLQGTWAP